MSDNHTRPHNRRTFFVVQSSTKDCWLTRCGVGQVAAIDVLPDDVLLAIFDFYVVEADVRLFYAFGNQNAKREVDWWQSLVHVCRRWRSVIFGSPRRLNLQLLCMSDTPARKDLDVWPALPLLIGGTVSESSVDNVVARLEHSNRICQISIVCHATSQFEKVWAAMQD